MQVWELILIVFGIMGAFWFLVWLGDLIAKTPKIFTYGRLRKFLN